MRASHARLAVLFFAIFAVVTFAEEGLPSDARISHRQGDDPRWAAPAWDDRDWEAGGSVPARSGIYWIRFHFTMQRDGEISLPTAASRGFRYGFLVVRGSRAPVDCLLVSAVCAYELYWDGALLGRSGVVGHTRDEEVVGPAINVYPLPRERTETGEHIIALRVSSFHDNFPNNDSGLTLNFDRIQDLLYYQSNRTVYPLLSAGGALLVAVLSLALFFLADRWRPLLLCSATSFSLALFYLLSAWRWLHDDPFTWPMWHSVLTVSVMTCVAGLFPWMLLEQFAVPRRSWWLGAMLPFIVGAWIGLPVYQLRVLWLARATLAMSSVIAGWAAWRKRPGAWIVLSTILVGLLMIQVSRHDLLNPYFFITFTVLVVVVFATLGTQVRAHRRAAYEAKLSAVRLEAEFLRRSLQPHFLFNTLAAVVEVIEQDPKTAVTLIESLSQEFRLFARQVGNRLIPLGQELELCRTHLRIMSIRQGAICALHTPPDLDERALVPPALFHALIENGITHLRPLNGEQRFNLLATRERGRMCYQFVAHGQRIESATPSRPASTEHLAAKPDAFAPPREGTGLRYIRARLEESFPGRWALESNAVDNGWRTVIEIDEHASPNGREKGRWV